MKRTQITEYIEYIEPDSQGGYMTSSGLVIRGEHTIMIDPNMGPEETAPLLAAENPSQVVLSHYHLDHSFCAPLAEAATGAEILVGAGEAFYLQDLEAFVAVSGAAEYGLGEPWAAACRQGGYRELKRIREYEPGRLFSTGAVEFKALAAPGHSPAHNIFHFPRQGLVFVADLGLDVFGPWYGWRDADIEAVVKSLLGLKELDAEVVLTGHAGRLEDGLGPLADRALEKVLARERLVSQMVGQGLDPRQMAGRGLYYPRLERMPAAKRPVLLMWESFMAEHHLAVLERGGLTALFPSLARLAAGL